MPGGHAGDVELRHLRYFVGVAEAASFTGAARRLRVAQPALSRQIRQLEEELGVPLLERDRTGVRLTTAGQAFLEEARGLLARSEEAVRTARTLERGRRGSLHLGYVWGLFHSIVPGLVEAFRQAVPEVAVHLFDYTATQQAEALREGRLDLGFIGFAEETSLAGLARRRVGSCDWVAALPAGHPDARRRRGPLALEALASEMFFVISEATYPGAAHLVAEACARAGFRPRVLQAADRGHTLLGLVAGNCGVALVPESLAALPHPGVVLRRLVRPPRGDLEVAWNPARGSTPRDLFLQRLAP